MVMIPQGKIAKGTVDGVCLAIKYGWAINLDGGHTHATKSSGNMFNIYPDISLAIHFAKKWHPTKSYRIMVINTSCAQANGVLRDYHGDEGVYMCDVFDPSVEPKDVKSFPGIHTQVNVSKNDNDESYITKIRHKINLALSTYGPDFVIYNAGYDIIEGDKIGNMNISDTTVMLRDEMIFREVYEDQGVPILMTVGGCYQKRMEHVIARSVRNIVVKFDLSPKQLAVSTAQNIRLANKLSTKVSRYEAKELGYVGGRNTTMGDNQGLNNSTTSRTLHGRPNQGYKEKHKVINVEDYK